jgi:hypothetical protein
LSSCADRRIRVGRRALVIDDDRDSLDTRWHQVDGSLTRAGDRFSNVSLLIFCTRQRTGER